jgi:hypothetical protein
MMPMFKIRHLAVAATARYRIAAMMQQRCGYNEVNTLESTRNRVARDRSSTRWYCHPALSSPCCDRPEHVCDSLMILPLQVGGIEFTLPCGFERRSQQLPAGDAERFGSGSWLSSMAVQFALFEAVEEFMESNMSARVDGTFLSLGGERKVIFGDVMCYASLQEACAFGTPTAEVRRSRRRSTQTETCLRVRSGFRCLRLSCADPHVMQPAVYSNAEWLSTAARVVRSWQGATPAAGTGRCNRFLILLPKLMYA